MGEKWEIQPPAGSKGANSPAVSQARAMGSVLGALLGSGKVKNG